MSSVLRAVLQKHFAARGSRSFALDLRLDAALGFTVLFGPSGAGKTTALECIAGLQRPESGRIAIGDHAVFDSAAEIDVPPPARGLGYVFQSLALFPHRTVRQNLAFGLHDLPHPEKDARIAAALESFHIPQLAGAYPDAISGGERQRVALARALVTRPRALLLDEPLSALELSIRLKILNDLKQWCAEHPVPVLYVTHSLEEAFALGGKVIFLEDGMITRQGTAAIVLAEERTALVDVLR